MPMLSPSIKIESEPLLDAKIAPQGVSIAREFTTVLLDELRRYLDDRPEIASRCQRLVRPDVARTAMTLSQAADLLHRSVTRVHEVVKKHGLLLTAEDGRGAPLLVDATAIRTLGTELYGLLDKRGLARVLHCSRDVVRKLASAGMFVAVSGPAAALAGRPVWRRCEAEALIRGLEKRCPATSEPRQRAMTASAALRLAALRERDPAALLLAIQNGDLSPIKLDFDAAGLRRIILDANEITRFLGCDPEDAPPSLSIPEASIALRLKQQVIYGLCASGLLRTVARSNPRHRGRRVLIADLKRFRKTYVAASHLHDGSGHHRGWIADRLMAAGVRPVAGPSIDGGRQIRV